MSDLLFCRFCAENELAREIIDFSSDVELRKEIVENISLFLIDDVDFTDRRLPQAVCTNCRESLNLCCNFLLKIRQSQIILRDLKNENKFSCHAVSIGQFRQTKHEKSPDRETKNKIDCDNKYSIGFDCENEHRNFEVKVEASVFIDQDCSIKEFVVNPIKLEVKEVDEDMDPTLNYEDGESCTKTKHVAVSKSAENVRYGCARSTAPQALFTTASKQLVQHTNIVNKFMKTNTLRMPQGKVLRRNKKNTPPDTGQLAKKETKELVCNICQKEFYSQFRFNAHKITHTSRKRNFKCNECEKSYFRVSELNAHINDTHLLEPQVCLVCKKVLQNKIRLKRHMKTHNEIKFECDTCHRQFTSRRQIAAHIKVVHSDRTPFLCKFCGKGFKLKGHLTDHENVHKKKTPYSCTECGRKFTMWGNCDKHMKRMHGLRLAKTVLTPLGRMPINQKTGKPDDFQKDRNNLVDPQIVKDFTCEVCRKKFDSKTILKDHQRIAHDIFKSQICPICKKKLTNLVCLKIHLKTHKSETAYDKL